MKPLSILILFLAFTTPKPSWAYITQFSLCKRILKTPTSTSLNPSSDSERESVARFERTADVLVSFQDAKASRQKNYRWPKDSLVQERVFDQLTYAYQFGILTLRNKLNDMMTRPEALALIFESYPLLLDALDFVKKNYVFEVFEEAQPKFLRFYFLLESPEMQRMADFYGVEIPQLTEKQRTQLFSLLPVQTPSRAEKAEVEELISASLFSSYFDEMDEQLLKFLKDAFTLYEHSYFDTYTDERSATILKFRTLIEKARLRIDLLKDGYQVDDLNELPMGELIRLQYLLSSMVSTRDNALMKYIFHVPWQDKVARWAIPLTFSEMRPEGTDLKVYWMKKINKYKKQALAEIAHLEEVLNEVNEIVPVSLRKPLPSYLRGT